MNDNGEESNAAYQDRMTKLSFKVSAVLDGIDMEESAVICARVCGFALGQIPHPHRIKITDIAMNVLKHAIADGEDAANAVTIEREQ